MNFTFFKWTGFWDPTILSDRFFWPTHAPKSFRRKDWETRTENWTTPNFTGLKCSLRHLGPSAASYKMWGRRCCIMVVRELSGQQISVSHHKWNWIQKTVFGLRRPPGVGPRTIVIYHLHCPTWRPFASAWTWFSYLCWRYKTVLIFCTQTRHSGSGYWHCRKLDIP